MNGNPMQKDPSLTGVVEAALEIARKRRDTLARLRAAVVSGDNTKVVELARKLCGVENDEESHRISSRVN
jgi:hypothetical protein